MTEFDLRALGWVVTRDACWEIARSLAGRTPRLPLAATRELTERWQNAPRCGRENVGSALDQDRLEFTIAPNVRRDMRGRCRFSHLAQYVVSGTVLIARVGDRCRRACAQSLRRDRRIYGARLPRRPRLPANRRCRGRAVRDGRLVPDDLRAAVLVRKLISQLACRNSYSGAPGLLP